MQSIGGRRLLAVTVSALAAAALLAVAGWMLLGGNGSPPSADATIQIIPPQNTAPSDAPDAAVSVAHSVPGAPSARHTTAPADTPAEIAVYITGAVAKPGVYRVAPGQRLDEVIVLAGGATQDADLSRINLAAYVRDAAHYRIPAGASAAADAGTTAASAGASDASAPGAGVPDTGIPYAGAPDTGESNAPADHCAAPIDINSARSDCLQTLPGIGRVRAETIVDRREDAETILDHREDAGPFTSPEGITAVSGIGNGIYQQIAGLITVRPIR